MHGLIGAPLHIEEIYWNKCIFLLYNIILKIVCVYVYAWMCVYYDTSKSFQSKKIKRKKL